MQTPRTTTEWAQSLGEQVRARRLDLNLEQAEVAARASISRPALHALENGRGSTLATLIKVLRELDATEWLTTLRPVRTGPSPLELLRAEQSRERRPRVKRGDR